MDGNEKLKDPGRRGRRRPEEPWIESEAAYKLYVTVFGIFCLISWYSDVLQTCNLI